MGRTRDVSKILNSNTPLTSTYLTLASASTTYATQTDFSSTAWTSYTPVVAQGGTTLTTTIGYAKYKKIGKLVFVQATLTIGSTGSAGSTISITLPSAALPLYNNHVIGSFRYQDTGTAWYSGTAEYNGTAIFGNAHNTGNNIGGAPSFTAASGDIIGITVMYEVA